MAHSFSNILIHAVWSTKDRLPLIAPSIEKKLFDFMDNKFMKMGCASNTINGMPDHVHILFRLNRGKSLEDVIKQVKGSSSYFVNHNDLITEKFSWQTGYAAYSVSDSAKDKVRQYILNQKKHHQTKSFRDEYAEFLKFCVEDHF